MSAGVIAAARLLLDEAPGAFAITEGPSHSVVYMNPAVGPFTGVGEAAARGRSVTDFYRMPALPTLLDRAFHEGHASIDQTLVGPPGRAAWSCSVWPLLDSGGRPYGTVILLRAVVLEGVSAELQRQVAERLLLSALREMDAASSSEAARERSEFLEQAGRELSASVDEKVTRATVSELRLPGNTTWCIVDVVDQTGGLCRLAIIHPDPAKHAAARALKDVWTPEPGDPFGAPAVGDSDQPIAIIADVDRLVEQAARGDDNLRALRELGIGSLLTVPMRVGQRSVGAITFVGGPRQRPFDPEELRVAQALALRSAVALDNARHYGEALELKERAQEGSRAKTEFLAHMSHELRTPLNAIAGFVDIIDLGIHGPVTSAQRADLERIRASQRHLLAMINDILNFMQIHRGRLAVHVADVSVNRMLSNSLDLIVSFAQDKGITLLGDRCDRDLAVRADPDRMQQILINLLTNAVKFTPSGGKVSVECAASDSSVEIAFVDTGIGIPADRIENVFEPFVQVVSGLTDRTGGVGLGLAISRDLARAMGGDITAESVAGVGSRFTLKLPRAKAARNEAVE